jgi:hypothetical protein
LRATATVIALSIVVGACGDAPTAAASPQSSIVGLATGLQAVGQFSSANGDARREADKLLKQARQAMTEGKFDLAEQLIGRAEQTGAKYDAIFARFVDTPEKLRQELSRNRTQAENVPNPPANLYAGTPSGGESRGLPAQSNQLYQPPQPIARTAYEAPSEVPASGGGAYPVGPNAGQDTFGGSAERAPAAFGPPAPLGLDAADGDVEATRRQSDTLLHAARVALAMDDLDRSQQALAQVRELGLLYPINADTPDKVERLIRETRNFAAGPRPGVELAVLQRQYADHLLQQSEQLLVYYEDLQQAERLARKAQAMPVQYGEQDTTPAQVLAQIQVVARGRGPSPVAGEDALAGGDRPMRLPTPVASHLRKAEAAQLLATTVVAMDRGDILMAQRLMQQVESLQVPPEAFGPSDLRPWEVSAKLNRILQRQGGVAPAVAMETGTPGAVQQGVYQFPDGRGADIRLTQGQNLADDPPAPLAGSSGEPGPGNGLPTVFRRLEVREGIGSGDTRQAQGQTDITASRRSTGREYQQRSTVAPGSRGRQATTAAAEIVSRDHHRTGRRCQDGGRQ